MVQPVGSPIRLLPCEVTGPEQSGPWPRLRARTVLSNTTTPPGAKLVVRNPPTAPREAVIVSNGRIRNCSNTGKKIEDVSPSKRRITSEGGIDNSGRSGGAEAAASANSAVGNYGAVDEGELTWTAQGDTATGGGTGVANEGAIADRQRTGAGDAPAFLCTIAREGTVVDGHGSGAGEDAAAGTWAGHDVIGKSGMGHRQCAFIKDAAPAKTGVGHPSPQGEFPQCERASRRNVHETELERACIPLEDGGIGPRPRDRERTGHHRKAGLAQNRIIDPRQGVGPCLQTNRVLFAIRIGFIDGVDETLDIASATMKGLCLDGERDHQSKPEGRHHRHSPGEAPPAQSPSNCASLRFQGLGMRLQVLRSLFQDFTSLTNIVHPVHVRILL